MGGFHVVRSIPDVDRIRGPRPGTLQAEQDGGGIGFASRGVLGRHDGREHAGVEADALQIEPRPVEPLVGDEARVPPACGEFEHQFARAGKGAHERKAGRIRGPVGGMERLRSGRRDPGEQLRRPHRE